MFQGGERISLLLIALLGKLKKPVYLSKESHLWLSIVAQFKLSYFLRGKLSENHSFQGWKSSFYSKMPHSAELKKRMYLSIKNTSILEVAASSSLFPCDNCFGFGKEYFLECAVFKVVTGSLCSKQAYQQRWRNTCIFLRTTISLRSRLM